MFTIRHYYSRINKPDFTYLIAGKLLDISVNVVSVISGQLANTNDSRCGQCLTIFFTAESRVYKQKQVITHLIYNITNGFHDKQLQQDYVKYTCSNKELYISTAIKMYSLKVKELI